MHSKETVKTTKARTRIQRLLSKIAGGDTSVNVKSKDEILLNEIAENGGGSSGSGESVTVDITRIGDDTGTWSGATWEELVNAYYDGRAFARFNAQIAPGVTGQVISSLSQYIDAGATSALYIMFGNEPMILDNLGNVTGNLP